MTPDWPETAEGGVLGDGRFAVATDRSDSIEAVCAVVRERVAERLAIYPQGGCTALQYGGAPKSPGVAVDVRGLDRVIDYPAADMTVTVEAGITLGELSRVLSSENQRLQIDPPQADRATLGGIFATNACGPRRYGQGRPRDQIIGIAFVTAEGVVVKGGGRVVKNVAGYDFPRLLTGSMGTLGVIVSMTLKVRPIPEASAVAWAVLPGAEAIGRSLDALNTSATRPVAIELLNHSAARVVGGALDLPHESWILAVGFEGNAQSVAWQLRRVRDELAPAEIVVHEGSAAKPVWTALIEVAAAELGAVRVVASMRPSTVVGFVSGLDPALWAVHAHAGCGTVRLHRLGNDALEPLAAEIDALRAKADAKGGALTLALCPTAWKPRLKVWGSPRPEWELGERVRLALDPHGVMNPGRFVASI
jgi:glycolate oxidase FAD binding subunit